MQVVVSGLRELRSYIEDGIALPVYTYQQVIIDHAKELFGEEETTLNSTLTGKRYLAATIKLLSMLQADKPDYEAVDEYIWSNCLLSK